MLLCILYIAYHQNMYWYIEMKDDDNAFTLAFFNCRKTSFLWHINPRW